MLIRLIETKPDRIALFVEQKRLCFRKVCIALAATTSFFPWLSSLPD